MSEESKPPRKSAAKKAPAAKAPSTKTPAAKAKVPTARKAAREAEQALEVLATTEHALEADHAEPDPGAIQRLLDGRHHSPHAILGAHPGRREGRVGVVVRAHHPDAIDAECVFPDGRTIPMGRTPHGILEGFVPDATLPMAYRTRFRFADGAEWERDDPYRFLPTLGEVDLHLFNEGTHRRLWDKLGAHVRTVDGVQGVAFAVWAPNAQRASVVGDFCGWDGRLLPMRQLGSSGVWELFVPELAPGTLYKYEFLTREGQLRVKTDPFASKIEQHPGTASIIVEDSTYAWEDAEWMAARPTRDLVHEPMAIYEVHLGSWARIPEDEDRMLGYREIAPRLAEHVKRLGFTHIELLPIMEHPFYGSWGYQVTGFFAPTSRYGTPDDFRFLVDTMHQHGIGVLLDWVPAHFPKDDYALRRFDGTALFEHEDPRMAEHPDWGTLVFNYERNEVRNFLVANALYWLLEYHVDGLRVDAVASMLYLDYSRPAGQWVPNQYGGRENLAAIAFLREMNIVVGEEAPGCCTIAEESTAWPKVTAPVHEGGLGFWFKWNMGWMHDTLKYFSQDPVHRRWHHDQLTFAMMYEYSERFVMPLSHDEVVHLKGSLLGKMPGDEWQQLANLRTLLAYQVTRPGKKLLFMGTELASFQEWNHDISLPWHLQEQSSRAGFQHYLSRLLALYQDRPALWRRDSDWQGFSWIDVSDREHSVVSYVRRDGEDHVLVVLNLTPVVRRNYRIGAPSEGAYEELLSSDAEEFWGSGTATNPRLATEPAPFHGCRQSLVLDLPPMAAVILAPERGP